jgi:hypothetical protein
MCCLRYEHEFYVQSRKRFPKEGKIVSTLRGEEKVMSNDIFRDRVTLRNSDGDVRTVPLLDLRTEIDEAQRRGIQTDDNESAFMTTGEWERLSARQLPLAQGSGGDEDYVVIDEDDVEMDDDGDDPPNGEAAEQAGGEQTGGEQTATAEGAPHRRRRGRRGGRRGRRRRGGEGNSSGGNPLN